MTSVLSACQMFAKCVDDPQVFVRIKAAKQITAISHKNRAKKLKKTATTIMKKEKNNVNKK